MASPIHKGWLTHRRIRQTHGSQKVGCEGPYIGAPIIGWCAKCSTKSLNEIGCVILSAWHVDVFPCFIDVGDSNIYQNNTWWSVRATVIYLLYIESSIVHQRFSFSSHRQWSTLFSMDVVLCMVWWESLKLFLLY